MKALLPCLFLLLTACSQDTEVVLAKAQTLDTRQQAVATRPAAPAAQSSFGGVMELFARTGPEQVVGAASSAPAAGPTPYARPDLSANPAERARAAELQAALKIHDMQRAQALVNTPALQQMYNEGQRAYAEHLRTESMNADKEPITGREP